MKARFEFQSAPSVGLRLRQGGRSMIELMVAVTISLVVLGTVMTLVVGMSHGSRTQEGQSRLTENAQIALNLVTGHLRMSGFSSRGRARRTMKGRRCADAMGRLWIRQSRTWRCCNVALLVRPMR